MKVGDVVISVFGHDEGEWYIVKYIDDKFIYLIDGKNKPLEKPKKKNLKHIAKTSFFASEVAEKIVNKQYIQNAEVRKALKFFKNNI